MNQLAQGRAQYAKGEIHRLRGELAKAEDAFRKASRCGFEPQPGLALLRHQQGRREAAAAAIRRAVGEAVDPLRRVVLLPAYVEIMLAESELGSARAACGHRSSCTSRVETGGSTCAPAQGLGALG